MSLPIEHAGGVVRTFIGDDAPKISSFKGHRTVCEYISSLMIHSLFPPPNSPARLSPPSGGSPASLEIREGPGDRIGGNQRNCGSSPQPHGVASLQKVKNNGK